MDLKLPFDLSRTSTSCIISSTVISIWIAVFLEESIDNLENVSTIELRYCLTWGGKAKSLQRDSELATIENPLQTPLTLESWAWSKHEKIRKRLDWGNLSMLDIWSWENGAASRLASRLELTWLGSYPSIPAWYHSSSSIPFWGCKNSFSTSLSFSSSSISRRYCLWRSRSPCSFLLIRSAYISSCWIFSSVWSSSCWILSNAWLCWFREA